MKLISYKKKEKCIKDELLMEKERRVKSELKQDALVSKL
jgi:hypothetical protein